MKTMIDNICHISSMHDWFDERIFYKECRLLAKTGFQVVLIIPRVQPAIIDSVKIVPIAKAKGKVGRIRALFSIANKAVRENAAVYHFHDPDLIFVGLFLKANGKKVVYDVHEDYEQKLLSRLKGPHYFRRFVSKLWWVVEKTVSRAFDQIVVADSHIKNKFNNNKTIIIPNVPSEEFWRSRTRSRTSDNEFRLIYVGTITRDRGILETIRALDFVKHNNVTFHIIGGTEDRELIDIFRSRPGVCWHGRVPWKELGNHLVNADAGVVLLQPVPAYLYCPGENIVKLWEYLSLGLPVLISDFPKLRKLCIEIGFGLAVDPTSPEKIAEAIDYLIDHPEEREFFSQNGIRAVREEYNAEKKMEPLIKFYDQLFL